MREILFKEKRIDNGEWVQGDLVHSVYKINDTCAGKYGSEVGMHQVDTNTICQYTGLTDKNGKKIWENDIVVYDNSPYNVYCTPHTGNIAYRNGCLCFKYWLYGSINYMPFTADVFFGSKCEVIGNTIDNPELLDNKTEF